MMPASHDASAAASEHASRAATPRVWVLDAPGAGDRHQLELLANALGWPWQRLAHRDTTARVLRDRLFGSRRRIPADRQDLYRPPWPDLLLTIGGRSVVDALRIRRASGGRTRLVALGRPWAALKHFDLVLTTPQYQLPERAPVAVLALPLNRRAPAAAEAQAPWCRQWQPLPRPWLGVLLGGSSGSYRWRAADCRRLAAALDARAAACAASLLVACSPRTPPLLIETLRRQLKAPHRIHPWQAAANPYDSLLAQADALVVTADSASMLAEACASGRPVAIFAPARRWHTRLFARPIGWRRWRTWRDRLIASGCWVPVRDMGRIHARLRAEGRLHPLPALPLTTDGGRAEALPLAQDPDLQRAVAAVRRLMSGR